MTSNPATHYAYACAQNAGRSNRRSGRWGQSMKGGGIAIKWRVARFGLSISLLAVGLSVGFSLAACSQQTGTSGGVAPAPVTTTADLPPYERIEPTVERASGTYVHRWSGLDLPKQAGAFTRARVTKFDAAALDVTAEYHLKTPQGLALANVYIYPMNLISPLGEHAGEGACRVEFSGVGVVLAQRFPGTTLVREWQEPAPDPAAQRPGLAAAYDFETDMPGPTMPVRSEVYLFCGVNRAWAVKYRITYPRGFDATDSIRAFIAASPAHTAL